MSKAFGNHLGFSLLGMSFLGVSHPFRESFLLLFFFFIHSITLFQRPILVFSYGKLFPDEIQSGIVWYP